MRAFRPRFDGQTPAQATRPATLAAIKAYQASGWPRKRPPVVVRSAPRAVLPWGRP